MPHQRIPIVRQLAEMLIHYHGIPQWKFQFNRSWTDLGRCRRTLAGNFIEISQWYVLDQRNPLGWIVDTILHEIAHALAGPEAGHGPLWRSYCKQVGAEPLPVRRVFLPKPWGAQCRCGRTYEKIRRPHKTYRCANCSAVLHWCYSRSTSSLEDNLKSIGRIS